MLVGEPGVGKTAVIEGLARLIELEPEKVPARLRASHIVQLQMGGIVAGTMLRGMFEERIKGIIDEVKERDNLILFIDEAHTIIGAGAALDRKALKLTGGPDSAKAPAGRNQYAWVMESGQADVFLTYCTNAVLARKEAASLKSVALPPELSVGADYGLIVLKDAPPEASRLALFILSPDGQAILASYGFDAPTGQ